MATTTGDSPKRRHVCARIVWILIGRMCARGASASVLRALRVLKFFMRTFEFLEMLPFGQMRRHQRCTPGGRDPDHDGISDILLVCDAPAASGMSWRAASMTRLMMEAPKTRPTANPAGGHV